MSMCYLCDLCEHAEFIASSTMVKCNGLSGAIVPMAAIDYGRDDPKEICKHFEAKEDGDD